MSYHQMKKRKAIVSREIQRLKKEIKKFPEGTLKCTRNKKYYKWFWINGKKRVYIPKDKRAFAEKLAIKKFYSLQLEELLVEEQALDAYFQNYNSKVQLTAEQFLENPEYSKLMEPYYKPIIDELKKWTEQPYDKCDKYPGRLVHKTIAGFKVRSKSEAMIVAVLYQNKIPFRYECALRLGDVVLFPDFTIRHPRTGELYYWEHFGRMDDENYCDNYLTKMNLYIKNGIIPTINLITTYETKSNPLGMDEIEKLVQWFFDE